MDSPARDGSLQLSPAEMQDLGREVLKVILDHFRDVHRRPVTTTVPRSQLAARFEGELPEHPTPIAAVMEQVRKDVFGNIMHQDHPRCFSFIPGPSNFVSALADALASSFNVISADWLEAAGPGEVELVTIEWLRQLCGLPPGAGGLFVSGGSMANLTALGVARQRKLNDDVSKAVIYCSDQTHSSLPRGLRVLGFGPEQVRLLPSDEEFRLSPAQLSAEIARDRAAGRRPFCVVANVGTTNTGAVDPLTQLVTICREHNLWLHADGAYGSAAVLCPEGREALRGLGEVDSLTIDPHKWLFQPYEIGCVLVRDREWLRDTYHVRAEYLNEVHDLSEEVHFCDYGIQLTRGFRAFKLWMSLKIFGLQAFREAIARGIRLAEFAESQLRASSCWSIVTPAHLGIVTFRPAGVGSPEKDDRFTQTLVAALLQDGYASLTSTRIRGRFVLRLCTINPRTTQEDIRGTLQKLEELAALRAGRA
jgi:aromatic-L-amino-acid/L-tryptophan decarboxylase